MITNRVEEALAKAIAENSSNVSILKILDNRLKGAVRSRKSGDTVPDEKAADIINQTIKSIQRSQQLSNSPVERAAKKIALLKSFL